MEFGVRHSMVLATDHLPKRQRPYRVVNVGLTDCFGIEWASEFPKAALTRAQRRAFDAASSTKFTSRSWESVGAAVVAAKRL